SSSGIIFKGPRFVLGHPDADQIAGEIVTLRQRMQSLACNVFLSDLTLEFDAVGVALGHGFHPWKARRPRSIPNPRPVHRQGRTPSQGQQQRDQTTGQSQRQQDQQAQPQRQQRDQTQGQAPQRQQGQQGQTGQQGQAQQGQAQQGQAGSSVTLTTE